MRQRSEVGEAALQLFSRTSEPVIHDETDVYRKRERERARVSWGKREMEIHKGGSGGETIEEGTDLAES